MKRLSSLKSTKDPLLPRLLNKQSLRLMLNTHITAKVLSKESTAHPTLTNLPQFLAQANYTKQVTCTDLQESRPTTLTLTLESMEILMFMVLPTSMKPWFRMESFSKMRSGLLTTLAHPPMKRKREDSSVTLRTRSPATATNDEPECCPPKGY